MTGTVLIEGADCPAVGSHVAWARAAGWRIVAIDIVADAIGFALADAAYVVPPYGRAEAARVALDVVRSRERIDLVVPSVDEGLAFWAGLAPLWRAAGTQVLISPPSAIAPCLDKLATHAFLVRNGLSTPPTAAARAPGLDLTKPRRGRGSRGVRRLAAHQPAPESDEEMIWQAFVDGPEYSVDLLCGHDGPVYVVVRRRLATASGISVKGEVVDRPDLAAPAVRLAEIAGFLGPVNVQFIDGPAGPMITDVNPRSPGGLGLSLAATENWWALYPRLLAGEPIVPVPVRHGTRMARVSADTYLPPGGGAPVTDLGGAG